MSTVENGSPTINTDFVVWRRRPSWTENEVEKSELEKVLPSVVNGGQRRCYPATKTSPIVIQPDKQKNISFAESIDKDTTNNNSRTPTRKKPCLVLPNSDELLLKEEQLPLYQDKHNHPRPSSLTWGDSALPRIITPSPSESTLSRTSSISSLAQILRGKISAPSMMKPKPPREYKLRAFVAFLFLTIVFLIGFSYVFYYQTLLQKTYFERIRFEPEERLMQIFDEIGLQKARATLGVTFPFTEPSFPCLKKDTPHDSPLCLEWMNRARFSLTYEHSNDHARCYRIVWQSLRPDTYPTDCFDMSTTPWYGGGLFGANGTSWPLNRTSIPMSPFVTSTGTDGTWNALLKRYFINAQGAAITIDENVPLWVSVNVNDSQQLCLQARPGSQYPFRHALKTHRTAVLNYTVCTASDTATLATALADKSMWDGIRKQEMEVIRELLEDPVWIFQADLNDTNAVESLMNYTNGIMAIEWTSPGYLLINSPWEAESGDLKFDERRFRNLNESIEIINRKGFKVAVTVRPFFSTSTTNYGDGLNADFRFKQEPLWLSQPDNPSTPSLTRYGHEYSMAMLDVTSPAALDWFSTKLRQLATQHELRAFYLDTGTSLDLPQYFQSWEPISNPSQYSQRLAHAVRKSVTVIGVNSAISMPQLPTFVSVPPLPSSWSGIQNLIPFILTLGVMGYPFLLPPPVGGSTTLPTSEATVSLPPRELYIRWLQLNTFLTVLQFTTLPTDYDDEVERIAANLAQLRKDLIYPILKRVGEGSVLSGLPIIRPLWMLDPTDRHALTLDDEFCVGDEILVAPIIQANATEREIYLPKGVWKDGIDGTLRKGGRWIHNHKIGLDEVAYFVRMPVGTRL